MLIPVVLAGGIGARLWPVSRAQLPKQFIQFSGREGSLFQETLTRIQGLPQLAQPIVLCNQEHRFLVAEQLRQLDMSATILLEPCGRNTAPAVALAAHYASLSDTEARLLVLPADHVISDPEALRMAISEGLQLTNDGKLVTFGIVPGVPETGYGYIEKGEALTGNQGFVVKQFKEKPDRETAEAYLASGNYLWNSGMFLFSAAAYLDELNKRAPAIAENCLESVQRLESNGEFLGIPEEVFISCPSDSIDYAVMEHTESAAVIPLQAGWNDLGSWDAIWQIGDRDDKGNAVHGDAILHEVNNSYIDARSRLVAVVGMDNALVVETADAVLVADKEQAQSVKHIVEALKAHQREEAVNHRIVYRPWGSYESLASGEGFQVKHIVVNPGAALSLQLHHKRAEHWTVIAGAGQVTCDEREFTLHVNESTFIPLGAKHRLANNSSEPLEIIEVQVGDYLGEDDIVRFEDRYGRVKSGDK